MLFYKPVDWRNKDILKFFQKTFGKDIKVGHSGTLDPFAEGLMVMGLGRKFTRQLHDLLLHSQKEYIAEIELGKTSNTFDITGSIAETRVRYKPIKEEIGEMIKQEFLGERTQIPPIYSAKKHKGKRLRDIADSENIEEIAESKSKKVTLYDFEIISYKYPILKIKLLVSSGYYIRSFGNSLGEKLKTGAYLTGLKRTKLGNYSVENALLSNDFSTCHSELCEESHSIELRGEISGNVQDVGLRYFTKKLADKLSLSGYIRNTKNNSASPVTHTNVRYRVEFSAQGNLESLSTFQTEILQSPGPIKISDYEFIIQKPSRIYKIFKIV